MSQPYVGQIEMFSFNFAPRGWLQCNGQILAIAQNQALFSLLGTMYGGNGTTTFALPNLQSRMPIGYGQAQGGPYYNQGDFAGEENHTLIITELTRHNHLLMADSTTGAASNGPTPSSTAVLGNSQGTSINPPGNYKVQMYSNQSPNNTLAPQVIGLNGGTQPHTNIQPYLVINFCIALNGIFPSRN
ncbi:phage tail protein [Bradyrhizobium prioriisuperbiae]|uniref:phage tail protein n=1 Tax=Bradyrhizobium prioriisuperbiae TaxID=2854389 RepID=UPI0028ED6729|nr:tail fiber protein [Bradyrhizobium prioritasuperba]